MSQPYKNQIKLVYDFYDNSLPTDLMNLFQSSANVHTTNMQLNSAIKHLIHIPGVNTTTYVTFQALGYKKRTF